MRKLVLVVAEETTLRAEIARLLQPAGYAVELSASEKRALELVATQTNRYDNRSDGFWPWRLCIRATAQRHGSEFDPAGRASARRCRMIRSLPDIISTLRNHSTGNSFSIVSPN